MAQKLDTHSVDRRLAALAASQHGLLTRAQLSALGLDDRGIGRRVRARRLHRIHRGVYAEGHPRLTRKGRFLAAVLAYGDRAVLSHRSAAVLWGLLPERGPRIDVTVPSSNGRTRRGAIVVHRCRLGPDELASRWRIPVTTPARTAIDLADHLGPRALERVLDEAHYLGLDLAELRPIPGRRGAGRLARLLGDHEAGSTRTRSDFEELLLALCRRAGLPEPRVNSVIEGFEVDFCWPQARLVVETDGWRAHGSRGAFERDRVRDAALVEADWRPMRITWRRLRRELDAVAAQLRTILDPGVEDSAP
jgi:very-short-patch-repair endonuclease